MVLFHWEGGLGSLPASLHRTCPLNQRKPKRAGQEPQPCDTELHSVWTPHSWPVGYPGTWGLGLSLFQNICVFSAIQLGPQEGSWWLSGLESSAERTVLDLQTQAQGGTNTGWVSYFSSPLAMIQHLGKHKSRVLSWLTGGEILVAGV